MDYQCRVIFGLGKCLGKWIRAKVALGIEHGLQEGDLEDFDAGGKTLDLESTTATLCASEELGYSNDF
jgi:hypothetical protein